MDQLTLSIAPREDATFKNFVTGPNDELIAFLKNVVTAGSGLVWIWGPRGCGKTHLVEACLHAASASRRSPVYAPLARLAREFKLPVIEPRAVAGVDDLERLAGNPAIERALFALVNETLSGAGSVVIASLEPPGAFDIGLPDLASRLRSGPVYRIRPLDDDDRLEVLKRRAERRGFELPDDTGRFLLTRCRRDMETLHALFERLDTASLAQHRKLTIPFVREIIERRYD